MEEAIEHRQAAGDTATALEHLLSGDRWFTERGASAAFLRLGEQLTAKVTDPRSFVALAAAAGESAQGQRCAHWLEAAEPLIDVSSAPLPGWRSLRAEADAMFGAFPAAGDAETALSYASLAVDLEDDPTLVGYVVARESLGGALLGAGRVPEAIAVLQDCWRSPARPDPPWLLLLQTGGLLSQLLVEVGDLDGPRRVSQEVRDVATAADLAALSQLAAGRWVDWGRAGANQTLDRAMEVAATGEARAIIVQRLEDLKARIDKGTAKAAHAQGALIEELTDRRIAILRALRGPLSAREIGAEMYLSINTVKGYTKSLYRKLGVATRADAVRRGHQLGLI